MTRPSFTTTLLQTAAVISVMTASQATASPSEIPNDPGQHLEEILRSAAQRGVELSRHVDVRQVVREGRAFERLVWEIVDALESADDVSGSSLYESIDYALAALLHEDVFSNHSMLRLRTDLKQIANPENLEMLAQSSELPQSPAFPSDPDLELDPRLHQIGRLVAGLGPRISILGAKGGMEDLDLLVPFLECGEPTIETFSRHAANSIRRRHGRSVDTNP